MKKIDPTQTRREKDNLDKDYNAVDLRVGHYFRKLSKPQKQRFNRIVNSIAYKYGLALNRHPTEMIIIRDVALFTVRIEAAQRRILGGELPEYIDEMEEWIFKAQKERRESINLLSKLVKVTEKKDGVKTFGDLRDILREKEGLEKSKKSEINPDGHDRRHYDDLTRST